MLSLISSLSNETKGYTYINEPVVDMRENPSDKSKVVSQACFSEQISIEREEGDWALIKTPDQYKGWVLRKTFVIIANPYESNLKISAKAAHIFGVKDTEFGPIKTVPYGSQLRSIDITDSRWIKAILPDGSEGFIQKGDVKAKAKLTSKGQLAKLSMKFLKLPYTWGGRSSFGFDCSGFVQMLYNQIGINLERDSFMQFKDPRFQTVSKDYIEVGDLIFFGKSKEKISHVGMYIGSNRFIHSTVRENKPNIHISELDNEEWNGSQEGTTLPYVEIRQLKPEVDG